MQEGCGLQDLAAGDDQAVPSAASCPRASPILNPDRTHVWVISRRQNLRFVPLRPDDREVLDPWRGPTLK
jgi:hypothetical protein